MGDAQEPPSYQADPQPEQDAVAELLPQEASSLSASGRRRMRAPTAVNSIGAVRTVRSSRSENRLYAKTVKTNAAIRIMSRSPFLIRESHAAVHILMRTFSSFVLEAA
jgi:hypothetical protein